MKANNYLPNTKKMRAISQRVNFAKLEINKSLYSSIDKGLLVFIGIEDADTEEDIVWLSKKIVGLRIFDDKNEAMNLSVKDIDAEIMVVSQFTLHASTKKGNRPSYIKASKPENAISMYEKFIKQISNDLGKQVKTGVFGANMQISLHNNGPVTIWFDTKKKE